MHQLLYILQGVQKRVIINKHLAEIRKQPIKTCLKQLKTNSLSNKYKYIHILLSVIQHFFPLFMTCFLQTATMVSHTLSCKANILFWLNIYMALLCPFNSAIFPLIKDYGGFHAEWKSRSRPTLFLDHRRGNQIH